MDGHIYDREIDDQAPDSLSLIIRRLPKQSHVLELGPATGYLTRYMQKNLGCQVDAVEISPEMAEQAAPYCRQMVVADLESTDLVDRFQGRRYDRIVIADVLEHIINRRGVLRACRKLLADDGRLLVSVPNITHAAIVANLLKNRFEYTDEGLLDHTHLHFFTRESIVRLLRQADFSVDRIDVVERLPEDTEIADSFTDLPAEVQQAILSRSDALTYQFVITAVPGTNGSAGGLSPETDTLHKAVDLRRQFLKQQNDRIQALNEKTDDLERIALERLDQVQKLSEMNQSLQESYRELESAYRTVEQMAVERLETINDCHDQLETYRLALKDAQTMAVDRMEENKQLKKKLGRSAAEIKTLSSTNQVLLTELELLKMSKWVRLGKNLPFIRKKLPV
jgi:2-polyprenyl-3-methyl-5-hydroxy-6-metoxy-1,4-benzoquinol methylase